MRLPRRRDGEPHFAAMVCAVAFALARCAQGWKTTVIGFFLALSMHALVAFTGTLVIGMVLHTVRW